MRVALAQIGSVPGAFDATAEHMLDMAARAARLGADLVLFPATALAGAYPEGLAGQAAFQLDMLACVRGFAARTPVAAVVPAYVSEDGESYYEVFLCVDGTACPLRRRSSYAPSSRAAGDDPSSLPAACSVGGVSFRFLVGDAALLGVPGAECDVAVALSPMYYCVDDDATLGARGLAGWLLLPGAEDGRPGWLVDMQGVGAYDDAVLAGGSVAVGRDGAVAASCPLFEEGVACFDVEPSGASGTGPVPAGPAGEAAAPAPVGAPKPPCQGGELAGVPLDRLRPPGDAERTGFLYRALAAGVRGYVLKSGFSDVAVGLSGGIDSSLVAAVAADALGPEHVLGVLMPGPYSSAGSVTDAAELAARLGVRTRTVPITPLYEASLPLLEGALAAPLPGLAAENLQARLRGVVLMAVSNATGALVLNTGNKSEAAMGYSTLYGDTVGAYAPLSDVYKGQVYALAAWRNSQGPAPVIPESVIEKPPSAELSEGQTDEGSLGASYAEIDAILALHVERRLDAAQIVAAGHDAGTVERVLAACSRSEYKRRQEPLGPVVSARSLDERGWPVVHGWRDRSARDAAFTAQGEWDGDEEPEPDDSLVPDELDAMLQEAAQHERVVGLVGDVAFGAMMSGQGADMDDCLGMPVFSKN